jgi:pimeloyl-ACP methyl ester carboxylesterase
MEKKLSEAGYTKIRGHRLYWELHGPNQGPVLVLLHHGLGSIRSWRKQVAFFSQQGWQVLAFDRWGYGRSDSRPSFGADFMQRDAGEALELLEALGIERAAFLGHSDGGTISLMIAANNPHLVEKLVLIAAHIYWEPKTVASIREIRGAADDPAMMKAWQREHGEKGAALVKSWADGWLQQEMTSLNLVGELPRIGCAALVIQGEEDEYATAAQAHKLAEGIADAELWMIPGAGHMPSLEIPKALNKKVLSFLGSPI